MSRRASLAVLSIAAAAALTGCNHHGGLARVDTGPLMAAYTAPQPPLVLGAGDALGWSMHARATGDFVPFHFATGDEDPIITTVIVPTD